MEYFNDITVGRSEHNVVIAFKFGGDIFQAQKFTKGDAPKEIAINLRKLAEMIMGCSELTDDQPAPKVGQRWRQKRFNTRHTTINRIISDNHFPGEEDVYFEAPWTIAGSRCLALDEFLDVYEYLGK